MSGKEFIADRVMANLFDQAGNWASGLELGPIGEDGHAVANLLWKVSGYLRGRGQDIPPGRHPSSWLLPVDDPCHRCLQGACDDHAGPRQEKP